MNGKIYVQVLESLRITSDSWRISSFILVTSKWNKVYSILIFFPRVRRCDCLIFWVGLWRFAVKLCLYFIVFGGWFRLWINYVNFMVVVYLLVVMPYWFSVGHLFVWLLVFALLFLLCLHIAIKLMCFAVIQLVASADCAGALDVTDDLQHLLVSLYSLYCISWICMLL